MVCGFSPVLVHPVRRLGYFALCGGRPGGSAPWTPATFEKAAKAFNTGLLCGLFSFMHASEVGFPKEKIFLSTFVTI